MAESLLVILLHGYARTRRDMASLASALEAAGHRTLSVQLPTTFGDLDECLAALDQQTREPLRALRTDGGGFALVGHSFGGLIARHWLARASALPRSLLTIATPHQGSELADLALRWPLVGRLLPPLAQLRSSVRAPTFEPPRAFRIGAIAGCCEFTPSGLLLPAPNDGRVSVASALPTDADHCRVLPLHHQRIHHDPQTLAAARRFLAGGGL